MPELQDIGETKDLHRGEVIETPIVTEMKKAYLDYAMSVIVSRALPDIRDGLKPVHRRIIYAAHKQNLTADSKYKKCAELVGEVMGKYHPHGDQSIYDALVRMAQGFSMRYPLIDGQGNFGNIDGDPPAAMRYTECRLQRISDYLLKDIDKDTVHFEDNYSAEYVEPMVLPSVLPNLLMNGSSGIAVGMATNIPPHNLGEIVDAIMLLFENSRVVEEEAETRIIKAYDLIESEAQIKHWQLESDVGVTDIIKVLKGPDFPTGAIIYDKEEVLRYYATGKGRILQRAVTDIEELKSGKFAIVVTEIPYQVNKTTLIEKIASLVTNKKVREISEIRDESSRGKIRIVIELKRDARPQKVLNSLFKNTQLQNAFNANMLALVKGEPKVLGIKVFLEEFINHRREVVINRTLFLLQKDREREHILEGLKKALDFIDEVIAIIRGSDDSDEAKIKLIKKFDLTDIQATAILDMQLRRLAALERAKIEDELNRIQKNIKRLLKILEAPSEMIKVIKQELSDIKEKFGDPRKTKVIKGKVGEFNEEDLIANEQTLISITESGYIKRMKPNVYKTQGRGGKGVVGMKTKDEDEVSLLKFAETHDRILFLTNTGKAYEQKVWDIPEASRTSKGTAIVNLIEMHAGEKLQEVLTLDKATQENQKNLFLLTASKNGQIKKTPLSEYENIRKTGIIAAGLKSGDELVRAQLTDGNNYVILVTAQGKSIRFKEEDARPMGRSAAGVRGIRLKSGDYVINMDTVSENYKGDMLLTISENGYGKMSSISEYSIQGRGGGGIIGAKVSKKSGNIAVARVVGSDAADILITSESGQLIRIPGKSVPQLSRPTLGVILMRMKKGDKVSSMSVFGEEIIEE